MFERFAYRALSSRLEQNRGSALSVSKVQRELSVLADGTRDYCTAALNKDRTRTFVSCTFPPASTMVHAGEN
jgi:hypothetical protein